MARSFMVDNMAFLLDKKRKVNKSELDSTKLATVNNVNNSWTVRINSRVGKRGSVFGTPLETSSIWKNKPQTGTPVSKTRPEKAENLSISSSLKQGSEVKFIRPIAPRANTVML